MHQFPRMAGGNNLNCQLRRPRSGGGSGDKEGAFFFFFFPDPALPGSNWIPRRFSVQMRGKLDSDSIASIQSANWEPGRAPKTEIALPPYAAFDFGGGVTVAVEPQSVEIEQQIKADNVSSPLIDKDRILPLARQLIEILDLRSVRSFTTQLRMVVPHADPFELLAERFLQRSARTKAGHRLSTVRLTLGYPVVDGEFRVTLIPYGPTAAWKGPHLSVRAELAFGHLLRKRVLELLANPRDYEDRGKAILDGLLGDAPIRSN
jgi:hypothetical protein